MVTCVNARFIRTKIDDADFMVKPRCFAHGLPMGEHLGKAVGVKVQAARKRRGLTQEQLAAQVQRSPESISNIERGRYVPSLETLSELSGALGVAIAEFLDHSPSERTISENRRRLEAEWQEVGRALNDRDLVIALEQAEVLLRRQQLR